MATDASAIREVNTADQFYLTKQVKEHKSELGKDEFLKIFLTQLQNQDPTSPMENMESIAQMAPFSALEAMTNMGSTMTQTQAYGMIGKGIIGVMRDENSGAVSQVIGTVDSAGIESGKPYVMVGKKMVWVEDVSQVFDNSIISGETNNVIAGTAMVGKYARVESVIDGVKTYIEGKVERMSVKDGKLYITVQGIDVNLNQVVNVADTPEALGAPPAAEAEEPAPEQAGEQATEEE